MKKQLRKELLMSMHLAILAIGDEAIYEPWIMCGVPDCPSDDDFDFIAGDKELFEDTVKLFNKLMAR